MRQLILDKNRTKNGFNRTARYPPLVTLMALRSLPLKLIPGSQGQHHHPNVAALGPTDSKPGICVRRTNEPPPRHILTSLLLPIDPLPAKPSPPLPLKKPAFPKSQAYSSFSTMQKLSKAIRRMAKEIPDSFMVFTPITSPSCWDTAHYSQPRQQ